MSKNEKKKKNRPNEWNFFLFRNAQGDLHDIKFEFNKATETVPDVVSEMVSASLIDDRDAHAGKISLFEKNAFAHIHSIVSSHFNND